MVDERFNDENYLATADLGQDRDAMLGQSGKMLTSGGQWFDVALWLRNFWQWINSVSGGRYPTLGTIRSGGSVKTMIHDDVLLHEGRMYQASIFVDALADGEALRLAILTGNHDCDLRTLTIITNDQPNLYRILEGPTITGGTNVKAPNMCRSCSGPMEWTHGCQRDFDLVTSGELLEEMPFGGGLATFAQTVRTSQNQPMILRANTLYVIEADNESGDASIMGIEAIWGEHEG